MADDWINTIQKKVDTLKIGDIIFQYGFSYIVEDIKPNLNPKQLSVFLCSLDEEYFFGNLILFYWFKEDYKEVLHENVYATGETAR